MIVVSAIWSASGLEITLDRILNAPAQIATLVGAMFPLDLSTEAFDRIIPKFLNLYLLHGQEQLLEQYLAFPYPFWQLII